MHPGIITDTAKRGFLACRQWNDVGQSSARPLIISAGILPLWDSHPSPVPKEK